MTKRQAQMSVRQAMVLAVDEARRTMREGIGGPFGAVILDPNHTVIAVASNTVLKDHDPTAHAEINAIRKAGAFLKTHDLKGCVLVTTCYPCPMCLSAALWANIDQVIYGCTAKEAADIGFRDDFILRYFEDHRPSDSLIRFEQMGENEGLELFKEYQSQHRQLY